METKLELDDPVTRAAVALSGVLGPQIDQKANSHPELFVKYQEPVSLLSHFCDVMDRPRIHLDNLSYLLDSYHGMLAAFTSASEFFDAELDATPLQPWAYRRYLEEEALLSSMFHELKSTVNAVIPSQRVLQHHFKKLVYSDYYLHQPSAEAKAMLAPLVHLRDEYFLSPRLELVTQYLKSAEFVAHDPFYHRVITGRMTADEKPKHEERLGELALELEVLSMVDMVYSAGATASPESNGGAS